MDASQWRATVSGSFRRHMGAIQDAVAELTDLGVKVLSPADPRVVDAFGDFLFVASDRLRSIRLVQERHLAAITNSQFLWLVTPDGYIGPSASMEIGYAYCAGVPVFSQTPPADLTLRQYVHVVGSSKAALERLDAPLDRSAPLDILVDPLDVVEQNHARLEIVRSALLHTPQAHSLDEAANASSEIRETLKRV